jgi:hypothetical protein
MMKTSGLVAALFFVCMPAGAAIQYEFQQVTHSDVSNVPSYELSGRAIIDGDRSRVDFVSGNAYTPGTYVISTNGARTLFFVDPTRKMYAQVNSSSVAAAVGASNLVVDNLNSNVTKLDDHPILAGVPTDHYRLTMSYDITLTLNTIALKQTVHTTIDKWTTVAFGDIAEGFLANNAIHTGNAKLDQIIDLETTKVKGFPLRETMQTVTTDARDSASSALAREAGYSRTRTQTREMLITSVRQADAGAAAFVVPPTYQRYEADDPHNAQTQVHMLSMEPK